MKMKYFEVMNLLKPQILRKLEDAYSEAGNLPAFRYIVDFIHRKSGMTMEKITRNLIIPKGKGENLAPQTLKSLIKIAKLLRLIDVKQNIVYAKSSEIAIIGCPRAKLGPKAYIDSLTKEERLYFLPRILEREGNMLLGYLSLLNDQLAPSENFIAYLKQVIEYIAKLYESAKPLFSSKISRDLKSFLEVLRGESSDLYSDPFEKTRRKSETIREISERVLRKKYPEKIVRAILSGQTAKVKGPPTYEKRLDMLRRWCVYLQLTNEKQLLTTFGRSLLFHPKIHQNSRNGFNISLLFPEQEILKEIFEEIPDVFAPDYVMKTDVQNTYFEIAANSYNYNLHSSCAFSEREFFDRVWKAYKAFITGEFRQVNLDAIKELIDIHTVISRNCVVSDFRNRIMKMQQKYPDMVNIMRSPFGLKLGYIFMRKKPNN